MPSNPGFEAVPAEVSTPVQIASVPTAPVQIACPFCKWNPSIWLFNVKCGVNGRKSLETLSDQIRWHVLGTHRKYNESLPDDAPDKIDPRVFERLATWNDKRRNWSNPRAIWREMYAAIADLDPSDPTIPDPDWTEEWVKTCVDSGSKLSDIKDRIANVKVKFEALGLAQEIKHVRKRKDEQIAVLRAVFDSAATGLLDAMYGLQTQLAELNTKLDDKVLEIETTSFYEIERLQTALRNKLKLAPTQEDMLSEVGSFMGDNSHEDANPQDTPRLPAAQMSVNPAHSQGPAHMAPPAEHLDFQAMLSAQGSSMDMDIDMADMSGGVAQLYNANNLANSLHNSFADPHDEFAANTPNAAFPAAVPQYPGSWSGFDADYAHSVATEEFSFTHVPSAANFSHNSETDTNDTSLPSQQSFGPIK